MVIIDGKVIQEFDLNKDILFTVEGDNGETNTFEIKEGYANMLEASCPDKLCIHQKRIHFDKETIVCLPNKVILQVSGGEDSGVDSIVQ